MSRERERDRERERERDKVRDANEKRAVISYHIHTY